MNSTEAQIRGAIAEQAATWFIANQDGLLEQAELSAFFAWLKTSPVHVQEYLGIARIARELPVATNNPRVSIDALLEQEATNNSGTVVALNPLAASAGRVRVRRQLFQHWPMATAAAVLLVTVSTLWWTRDGERFGLSRTYQTAHGVQSAWRLPDGSVLHLNTDTAVTVHFSGRERTVDLKRGEAFFEVAHESARRFRVAVGAISLWAVGTRFDVYAHSQATELTVVEGTVFAADRRIEAGYRLYIPAGALPGTVTAADTRQAIAWLQQRIVFEQQPLSEVADEFNRYGRVPVVVDDVGLRNLRLSGMFNAYDTDSFAAFLGTLDRVSVEKTATQFRVSRISGADREPRL